LSENTEKGSLEDIILQVTSEQKPETVEQLVELVMKRSVKDPETLEERTPYMLQRKQTLETIMKLQEQGKLQLTPASPPAYNFSTYLKTPAATWFWTVITLMAATLIAVFTIPSASYPLVYVRYALGIIFILWLPGYCLTKMLFPKKKTLSDKDKRELDLIERAAISIGVSLAIVPMIGLLLNYTPWGIAMTPIVLSLIAVTTILAVAGVTREYQTTTRET